MSPATTKWIRRGVVAALVLAVAALAVGSASKQKPQATFSNTGASVESNTHRSAAVGTDAVEDTAQIGLVAGMHFFRRISVGESAMMPRYTSRRQAALSGLCRREPEADSSIAPGQRAQLK
jgi:hypothetical protein